MPQAVAWPSGSSVVYSKNKCPRQESNLVYDLRKVACLRHTPRTITSNKHHNEESNPVLQHRRLPCFRHTRRACHISIPTGNRTRTWTFGGSNAIRYTIGNQGHPLAEEARGHVAAIVLNKADDWVRTSITWFTRPAPFSVEPRRQSAPVQGVEPCAAALETACSPGSTPVNAHGLQSVG